MTKQAVAADKLAPAALPLGAVVEIDLVVQDTP